MQENSVNKPFWKRKHLLLVRHITIMSLKCTILITAINIRADKDALGIKWKYGDITPKDKSTRLPTK